MLHQLKLEKWRQLSTLSGNAEHVPEAVLGLLSDDEVEFKKAYWKLENHVVVQGDLYSAAGVLPKYLEQVVIEAKFKPDVLKLMFQIGNGYSDDKQLQSACHQGIIGSLRRLLKHPDIVSTATKRIIERDLHDLIEIEKDRNSDGS